MKKILTAVWSEPTGKVGVFMSLLGIFGALVSNELLTGEIVTIVAMTFLFINMFGVSMIVKIINKVQVEKVKNMKYVPHKKKH